MSFKVKNPSLGTAVVLRDDYIDITIAPEEMLDLENIYQGELWRFTFSAQNVPGGNALRAAIMAGTVVRYKDDGITPIPYPGVAASIIMQDLTYTAGEAMECGNNVSIGYVSGATAGSEYVTIAGQAITVHIADGVSTANQVKTAIEANPTSNALVVVTVTGIGTNPQYAGALKALKAIQDLTFTADSAGAAGDLINITYIDSSPAISVPLSVILTGDDIEVTLGTDLTGALSSTADAIKTLLDGTPLVAAKVDITVTGTGTTIQAVQAQTFLEGGYDAASDMFGGSNDPFYDAIWLWHVTRYQWEALAGSYGCPSDINRYVTEADPRANPGSDTQPVTSTTTDGTIDNYAKTDHTHQGIHSLKANGLGLARYGDVVLAAGTDISITDNGSGTFTFDVAASITTEFAVSEGTGLVADYNAGKATIDGTVYLLPAGTVTVVNGTNYVYLDIDGVVKANTTGYPPNATPLAVVVAAAGDITSVTDNRGFVNQNLVWGDAGDITTIQPDDTAAAGTTDKYAMADHKHAIVADAPLFLGETGAGATNAEGDATSFSRADHEHKWQLVTSFATLPATPVDGQIVWAKYGVFNGLFYYDTTRTAWLALNENVKHWNSGTNVNTITVNLISNVDDTQQDNDYPNPYPITITGLLGTQSNVLTTNNNTKFEVAVYDLTTGATTQDVANVTLSSVGSRAVRDMAVNVDIADLTVLSARRVKTGTGTAQVTRPALSVFYRVRLA